jgi:predicted transglutaminase-like cysteine proteinase
MRLISQVLFALVWLASFSLHAETRFQPWSENVFKQLEVDYGATAAKRLRHIHDVILKNIDQPLRKKLEVANDTLNSLPWITDKAKYSKDDYWATPLETIALFGGDCEDMAIGKYVMLRMMGVPQKNLYLAYVKVKATGESHMVLLWLDDNRKNGLVLDNFVKEIKPAKQRADLAGVFLFSAKGDVIVLDDKGGKRTVKLEAENKKIKKLETIKQRMKETREKYKAYNNGRPLF